MGIARRRKTPGREGQNLQKINAFSAEEAAALMTRAARLARSGKSVAVETNLLAHVVRAHMARRDTPKAMLCLFCSGPTVRFGGFFTILAPTGGTGGAICPDCYDGSKQEILDRVLAMTCEVDPAMGNTPLCRVQYREGQGPLTLNVFTAGEAVALLTRAARIARSGKSTPRETNLLSCVVAAHEARRDTPEPAPCFFCGASTSTIAGFFTALVGPIEEPTGGSGGVICPDCYYGTKQEILDRILALMRAVDPTVH